MRKVYVDTETLGLGGCVKLIQYSVDRGPVRFIKLPRGWQNDLETRLALGEFFHYLYSPETLFIGWNTSFDLFKLYQLYEEYQLSICTPRDVTSPPFSCKVLDLYNHACFVGPFAPWAFATKHHGAGGKKVCAVRRVPTVAVAAVEAAVTEKLRAMVPGGVTCHHHEVAGRPDLTTLSWTVQVSMGLKAHAEHWGEPVIKLEDVWPLPPKDSEKLWLTKYRKTDGRLTQPYEDLEPQCDAVMADPESPFYVYARKDIEYLWLAEDKLGMPQPDHHDTATHVVAYTRYFGFPLDRPVLETTQRWYGQELTRITKLLDGVDLKSAPQRKAALQKFDPLIQSTKKTVLESIVKLENHPARTMAEAMLKFGSVKQKLDQCIKAGESIDNRVHPDLRVLGTATGRMAGTGGFNIQGVGKTEEVVIEEPEVDDAPENEDAVSEQEAYDTAIAAADASEPADAATTLVGLRAAILAGAVGDFHQFEIAIAASAWGDDTMLKQLDEGIDIHLATAIKCHPKLVGLNLEYDVAKAARKDRLHNLHTLVAKCRDECKRMVFGILYGCTEQKIADVFGVTIEEAREILERFYTLYPGIFRHRKSVESRFCTADTKYWRPNSVAAMDCQETDLTGFTRHWDFEKAMACVMWELGRKGVKTGLTGTIVRQTQKGPQTIDMAVRSAFLGAAIAIQQAVYRQAANMKIQATGANLCKMLQAELWDAFLAPMMNIHDELVSPPDHPNFNYDRMTQVVDAFVAKFKRLVKHLRFDLSKTVRWSDKA